MAGVAVMAAGSGVIAMGGGRGVGHRTIAGHPCRCASTVASVFERRRTGVLAVLRGVSMVAVRIQLVASLGGAQGTMVIAAFMPET